jgi:hypothetical protein
LARLERRKCWDMAITSAWNTANVTDCDPLINKKSFGYDGLRSIPMEAAVGLAATEKELAGKTVRFIKAELKRANVTYGELAKRLETHGLKETEASVSSKLARGTITATFLLATLAALEMEGMRLEDL